MIVTVSDPVIQVEGWTADLDYIGEYDLKIRKTPEEMRKEREERRNRYPNSKHQINATRKERRTVITKDPANQSVAYFLPGLWPRVQRELKAKGRSYTVVDKRNKAIRPEMDYTAFEGVEFRAKQDLAIATIAASDCGIIDCATAFGKGFCLALICKAYPTLNIVVTTSSTQVVATLYTYLCKVIPGEVGVLYGGKDTTSGKRVIVTTLKSLDNIPPDNVHLVFVDECHAVGDGLAARVLMKFCFARRFGFSASVVRNDGSGKVLESVLGPVIMKMDYQEAVEAGSVTPMKYMMLPCASCPNVATNENMPEIMLKKWSYWCNDARNRAIRKLVYDIKNVYDGQILIMVSTLVHAVSLQRLLPWFKVACYGAADLEALKKAFPKERYPDMDYSQYKMSPKQLDIMRKAYEKGTLKYVIATKTWKQGVDFKHLDVLIRADGDVSAVEGIQIPGRLARLDEGKDYAYLIDIADTFSSWAARRATARQELYKKQQWEPITYQELINDLSRKPKESREGNAD